MTLVQQVEAAALHLHHVSSLHVQEPSVTAASHVRAAEGDQQRWRQEAAQHPPGSRQLLKETAREISHKQGQIQYC